MIPPALTNRICDRERGEKTMPAIFVNIIEGKTREQKDALVKKLTEAAVEAVDALPEKVSVFINEFPASSVARNGIMYDKQ